MAITYEGATSIIEKEEACRLEMVKLNDQVIQAGEEAKAAKQLELQPKFDELTAELSALADSKKATYKVTIK